MKAHSIEEHHKAAHDFESRYQVMRQDYHGLSFTYGRKKIQDLLQDYLNQIPKAGHVLDIGCGTGEQLRLCNALGFVASGLEPAANMREIAQRNNPGMEILDGTCTRLPYANGSFDFVFALEVLRYLMYEDVLQSYKEMIRVARPGGVLFFTMVNRYALDGYYIYNGLRHVVASILRTKLPIQCHFTTPKEVRHDLQRLGIKEILHFGRMQGLLRLFYRTHDGVGSYVAKRLESMDDWISRQSWSVPFAGHLIIVARIPALSDRL